MKNVNTIIVSKLGELLGTDCSDSRVTLNTINSLALSFGPLAPGEISETVIIYLKVPSAIAINNIKIGLVDCGELIFNDSNFGIEIQPFLDYNIVPSERFEGINSLKDTNSIYNVSVSNRNLQSSNYVYLNVSVPRNQTFGTGTFRYKWFFEYL